MLRDYTREERTTILATLAAVVNLLTFGLGIFVTSRIVTRLGMTTALALVPVIVCAGLLVLAFAALTDGAGLGVAAIAGLGAAIAAVWAAAGVYLGGVFRRHSAAAENDVPADTPSLPDPPLDSQRVSAATREPSHRRR